MQQWAIGLGIAIVVTALGLLTPQRALTKAGVIHAALLGLIVWGSLGWPGFAIVGQLSLASTMPSPRWG